MRNLRFFIVMTLFIVMTFTASAHHGSSGQFDTSQTIEVSGEVTRIKLVNPHAYVYFDVTDASGNITNNRCELQSGSLLKRRGWTPALFKVGSKISILGSPDRTDPTTCMMSQITFENGLTASRQSVFNDDGTLANDASDSVQDEEETTVEPRKLIREDGTPNIDGNWALVRAKGERPGGHGSAAVLTQAGKAAVEGATSDQNPRFECKVTNIIMDWWFDEMVNTIKQSDSTIRLKYGFMNLERTIYLDGTQMPADFKASRAGFSTGEWQGDTLVVTTTGFDEGWIMAPLGGNGGGKGGGKPGGGPEGKPKDRPDDGKRPPGPPGGGPPSPAKNSLELTVTEYFTLNDDGTVLTRKYTLTDPINLKQPLTGSDEVTFTNDAYEAYACDDLTTERQANSSADNIAKNSDGSKLTDSTATAAKQSSKQDSNQGSMPALRWLEDSSVGKMISSTEWGYPIVLTLHAIGMATLVGVALMLTIRMLGFASFIPVTAMAPYWRVAQAGFILNLFSGAALFCGNASELYFNWAFRIKIILVFIGLFLTWRLVKICIKRSDEISKAHVRLAAIAMLTWVAAIIAGRLIGYWS